MLLMNIQVRRPNIEVTQKIFLGISKRETSGSWIIQGFPLHSLQFVRPLFFQIEMDTFQSLLCVEVDEDKQQRVFSLLPISKDVFHEELKKYL